MCNKATKHVRRNAVLRGIHVGLKSASFFALSTLLATSAFGQLRTGRDSDRDFYDPSQASSAPQNAKTPSEKSSKRSVAPAKNTGVVQASASVPKMKRNDASSSVQLAGCKNCQAGVPHSHLNVPMAETPEPTEAIVMSDDNDRFDMEYHEPQRLRHGHGDCDPCGTECGPMHGHSMGLLARLLSRSQFRIEAATFWPEGQNLPELVTTNRTTNPDPNIAGTFTGDPNKIVLFGGEEVLKNGQQGIRGEIGMYLDLNRTKGVLFRFFDAGSNSLSFNSTSTSEAVITRPFLDEAGDEKTIAVNFPLDQSGSLNAKISSRLYGGDLLFRKVVARDPMGRIEFLGGYQTAFLGDDLRISSSTTKLRGLGQNTVADLTDHFSTNNRFNGLALGLSGNVRDRYWSLSGMFKLGFGNMDRRVGIDGSSTITVPGVGGSVTTTSNGLLARNTNNGLYVDQTFITSPELNLTLGYQVTRQLEATIGYSYLGLPKVARVADQLDPDLTSNLSNPLAGDIRPSFNLLESNFSLHTLNYGLQWKF